MRSRRSTSRRWSTLAEAPAGHLPIRLLAHHALWDSWVHERDIVLPLGLTPPVEPDEVAACLRFATALSPAFAISAGPCVRRGVRGRGERTGGVLHARGRRVGVVHEGAAPTDAPCLRGNAVELVEALSLRVPLPASTPIEWQRLLGGLATVFDAEVDYT